MLNVHGYNLQHISVHGLYIYIYINNLCVRSCLSTNCYHLNLVLRFNAIKQSLAVHRAP